MISDRKLEHLLICKNYDVNYKDKTTGFEDIELIHRALPEVHKEEIDISTEVLNLRYSLQLLLEGMLLQRTSIRNWLLLQKKSKSV